MDGQGRKRLIINQTNQNDLVSHSSSSSSVNQKTNINSERWETYSSFEEIQVKSIQSKFQSNMKSKEELGLFTCSICGVDQVVDKTVMSGSHIEYIIEFSRLLDGKKRIVQRRYRQLRRWYNELVIEGMIANSEEIPFPEPKGITSHGFSNDLDSPFILNRIVELQTWLRWIFANYSFLYQHPPTVFFFNDLLDPTNHDDNGVDDDYAGGEAK